MDIKEGAAAIEAILFTMGESVEIDRLGAALDESPIEIRGQLEYLKKKYAGEDSGMNLLELEDRVQLCTKKELYPILVRIAKVPKKVVLTDALMETLSIIAYKQPITKLEVERIRGVNSDRAVSRLVEMNLAKELGRLDAPGRPLLFGTTEQFLKSFGVRSLEELPELSAVQIEEMTQEAEREADVRLDI